MTDEIRVVVASLLSGGGGAGLIIAASRLFARWYDVRLDTQEADAEETRAEAAKDTTIAGIVERLQSDVDQLKAEQAITKAERDAAIEESKSYKIALNESSRKYEALQNEFSVMKSDYSRQEERIEKLEKQAIEMRASFDVVTGERDKLAKELENERKSKLELEKVAEKERHQHVVELTRRDTKIELLEKSVEDLRHDLRHVLKEAVTSASEAPDAAPGESNESRIQESQ